MNQISRRNFFGMSAMGLAAAVLEVLPPASAEEAKLGSASEMLHSREISVWVTSGDERFVVAPRVTWRPASCTPVNDQLQLNPSIKFQEILGFGGAFTDATCYMLNQLAPSAREKLFLELFHPSE